MSSVQDVVAMGIGHRPEENLRDGNPVTKSYMRMARSPERRDPRNVREPPAVPLEIQHGRDEVKQRQTTPRQRRLKLVEEETRQKKRQRKRREKPSGFIRVQ